MIWRIAEGFKDPTAGQAIENVMRERKRAMQLDVMKAYLGVLRFRAIEEQVEL